MNDETPVWVYLPRFGFRPGFLLERGRIWSRVRTRLGTKVGVFAVRKVRNEAVKERGSAAVVGFRLEGGR